MGEQDIPGHPAPQSFDEELARFAEDLRHLRISCGNPSLRELEKQAPPGRPLSASALSEAFNGRRLPRLDFLVAVVRTLLAIEEARPVRDGDARIETWRVRWQEMERLRQRAVSSRARTGPNGTPQAPTAQVDGPSVGWTAVGRAAGDWTAGDGAPRRGARPRLQRGQDTMIRLSMTLVETTFGSTKELQVDTAVTCTACWGEGAAPGTTAQACDVCRGEGEVSQATRSFLGQVMVPGPCSQCQGSGTVVPTPCPECAGDGRVRARRTLTVKIPAGVDNGTRIQLAGEGDAGPGGGPAGDLYVEVVEIPHELFQRHGDDLHCTVTIPMTAAILGTRLSLPTLDGPEELEIPPGTQSGHAMVLHGRGAARLRRGGRADLLVHVEVATPTTIDSAQAELVRRLAALRGEETPSGTFVPGRPGPSARSGPSARPGDASDAR
ncbi:hypothetical protein GCM10009738_87690 [Kitasatospora viridis]|uniref:Chaperone protein DnaJ n=1 Tax=Kitasatospora viridis TaxID=281105 RepID=A0A561SES3_9ACTN|nr:DnaJ-like protein [Kitasatospora viridis]